jgi:Glycine-zipper domain
MFSSFLPATAYAQTDIFIYPAKGQNQAQQDKDRYECHSWAVQQTGFDPSRPQIPNSQPPQQSQPTQPHILKGAGRGAALGAVGGAITGDAGKGAAAGAAMGGIVGGFRRRDERMRQADVRADSAAATSPRRSDYMRAMSACLQGRGYTVN